MGMGLTKESLVGNVFFPLTNYLFNRRHVLENFLYLCGTDRLPMVVIQEIQLERLKTLIKYTAENIPYYMSLYRSIGLEPNDIRSIEDIKRIPPLSRQDVIAHHREMVDLRLQPSIPFAERAKRGPGKPIPFARFKKHKLVKNTSSGSTGAPTVFYEDGSRSAMNWAYEMRLKSWYGIHPGAREARMSLLSNVYREGNRVDKLRERLWHQIILPGTNLSDDDYKLCHRRMKDFRSEVLWGYTSALAGFADYIGRSGADISLLGIKLAVTWAAPLYNHEERIIRKTFGCPVTNIYSAREVGHIAATCPEGTLHVNQENLIVESVKTGSDGSSIDPGEILVTTLDITPMPFIRYRMGDVGEVENNVCACGRSLQKMKNLLGRTGEIFITSDGRMISPNFWCRVFMSEEHSTSIRRFQIIYRKTGEIDILVERGDGYSSDTEEYIRDTMKNNFSGDTKFNMVYVEKIEPQVSGKYQMVVNEAKILGG